MNNKHRNQLDRILAQHARRRQRRILLADGLIALMMALALASPMWLGPLLRLLGTQIDN